MMGLLMRVSIHDGLLMSVSIHDGTAYECFYT